MTRSGFSICILKCSFFLVCALILDGCSIKRLAVNRLGDALASGGTSFSSDDDPDLVKDAAPFSLKTMEVLLAESPGHVELRRAAAAGFVQYAYAFVQQEADEREATDFTASEGLRSRARRLYLRAQRHGLNGLSAKYPGFEAAFRADPNGTVRRLQKADVPLVYWTAVAWAAAISQSKDQPALIGELPLVGALMERALVLDEAWNRGSLHSFFINYEMLRPGNPADAPRRAKQHFERAMALASSSTASARLAYAEAVCVPQQDRAQFEIQLEQVLHVDADAQPDVRLETLIMQRRARWLLGRVDELFVSKSKVSP